MRDALTVSPLRLLVDDQYRAIVSTSRTNKNPSCVEWPIMYDHYAILELRPSKYSTVIIRPLL